jgi:hypothetical protein
MEVDRTGVTTGNQGNRPGRSLPRTAHHRQAIAGTEMLTSRYGATAPSSRVVTPGRGIYHDRRSLARGLGKGKHAGA